MGRRGGALYACLHPCHCAAVGHRPSGPWRTFSGSGSSDGGVWKGWDGPCRPLPPLLPVDKVPAAPPRPQLCPVVARSSLSRQLRPPFEQQWAPCPASSCHLRGRSPLPPVPDCSQPQQQSPPSLPQPTPARPRPPPAFPQPPAGWRGAVVRQRHGGAHIVGAVFLDAFSLPRWGGRDSAREAGGPALAFPLLYPPPLSAAPPPHPDVPAHFTSAAAVACDRAGVLPPPRTAALPP